MKLYTQMILSGLLLVALALGFAACSPTSTPAPQPTEPPATQAPPSTEPPATGKHSGTYACHWPGAGF